MNELEEKLNALLSNPQLMQQIAGLAQTMGGAAAEQPALPPEEHAPGLPSLDPRQIQLILQAVNQTGVDQNQHALLSALSPYLSTGKLSKLEKAMRASRIAGAASMFLNSGTLQMLTGR